MSEVAVKKKKANLLSLLSLCFEDILSDIVKSHLMPFKGFLPVSLFVVAYHITLLSVLSSAKMVFIFLWYKKKMALITLMHSAVVLQQIKSGLIRNKILFVEVFYKQSKEMF